MSGVFELNIWGHRLIMSDPNSLTLKYVSMDFEKDNHGARGLYPEPRVILDVGAHVGTFSVLMGKEYPKARIHAVEPVMKNFIQMQRNLKVNDVRASTYLTAISHKAGHLILCEHPTNSGSSSQFNIPEGDFYKEHKVNASTLDNLMLATGEKHFDLVKIDIEGSEFLSLKHFKSWDKIGGLTLEVHTLPGYSEEDNALFAGNLEKMILEHLPKERLTFIDASGPTWTKWGVPHKRELLFHE